ncbi:MAG TPA: DUF1269 domain-containing protein [Longimicrobiaceae bacterium]|nr:DUF1269 domain-containing protein [Longimicrobiaceae bacterium]
MPNESEWHVPRLSIVLFRFPGVHGAQEAVRHAKEEGWHCEGVEADALVWHEASGKVHMHDPGAAITGGAVGVTVATLLGLIGGPVVLLAMVVAGGLIGGIAGHFAGQIIPPDDLRKVGDALPRNSSAYLVLVEERDIPKVKEVFAGRAEEILTLPVETELAGEIGPELSEKLRHVEVA